MTITSQADAKHHRAIASAPYRSRLMVCEPVDLDMGGGTVQRIGPGATLTVLRASVRGADVEVFMRGGYWIVRLEARDFGNVERVPDAR